MKKTIEDGWLELVSKVMPPEAGPDQRLVMRRSFYAGVSWCLGQMTGPIAELSDEEGALELDRLMREARRFGREIEAGRA